ncbi:MAG: 2-phosphosulfolactate phosphatase [Cyclobacteriaceae bacterium]
MRTIETCLTPELIHQHELQDKIIVVVDIFRATSCIVTGLGEGVAAIYPVSTVEACKAFGAKGMIMAGERGGIKVEGFDLGNSPFEYMNPELKGKEVSISTTNGTLALEKSKQADEILVGAFLNLSTTIDYLKSSSKSVLVHCAGWKGTPNLEDTLYAGALIHKLNEQLAPEGDAAKLARDFYRLHQSDTAAAAKESGHAHRLAKFGVTKDQDFCLEEDEYNILVKLEGKKLIKS